MRAAMAALREEGGAGVCSRINVSESHGILSLKIPCRFQPVSEFVFGTYDAAFVQAMYEDYLRDPSSVGQEWRELFDNGKLTELTIIRGTGSQELGVGAATPAVQPPPQPTPAPAPATPPPGSKLPTPITGPAARLVANMTD